MWKGRSAPKKKPYRKGWSLFMLRAAIIGCGGIAQVHAQALSERPDTHLVAAADCRLERAEALCARFGGAPYQSFRELLQREQPDVIHLCTPHSLHVPMAEEALGSSIHVLSEKPAAISPDQLQRLRDTAKRSPAQYGVCFQNRYNPCVQVAKERIASGASGKILAVRAFVTWSREAPYYTESGWRGTLQKEGGGVLTNQAIHTLDLVHYLGGEIVAVSGQIFNQHLRGVIEVEDTACALLQYESGAAGIFYATTAYNQNAPVQLEFVCEQETLRLEGPNLYRLDGNNFTLLCGEEEHTPGKAYWGSSHARLIDAFYSSLLPGGESFPIGAEEGGRASELLFSLYAQNGIDYESLPLDETI